MHCRRRGGRARARRARPADPATMSRRRIVTGDEHDAYTSWRKYYCYLSRAGQTVPCVPISNGYFETQVKAQEGW